jgi:hypothetical protein
LRKWWRGKISPLHHMDIMDTTSQAPAADMVGEESPGCQELKRPRQRKEQVRNL